AVGVFGGNLDQVAVDGDGLVPPLLILEGAAQLEVGDDVFRVDFDGFAVGGVGRIPLLQAAVGFAEVEVSAGPFLVEFDGLAIAADRRARLALPHQGDTEVVVGGGRTRSDRYGRGAKPNSPFVVCLLPVQCRPQLVVQPEISRIDGLGVP